MEEPFKFPFAIKSLELKVEVELSHIKEISIQYDENHKLIKDPEKFDQRIKDSLVRINARIVELLLAIEFMKTIMK